MTNWEYLTQKENIRELAEELISETEEVDYDYNYDEELEIMGSNNYYVCSDGEKFDACFELEDAIEHEIEWLEKERVEWEG